MSTNPFQELEKRNRAKFDKDRSQKIRSNIASSTGLLHFIGSLVELYVPQVFDVFVKMTGGQGPKQDISGEAKQISDNPNPKYPNTKDY